MNVEKLQKAIKNSQLSNLEIASACQVSPTTLYNLMNGADVKVSTLEALAKVLGYKVGYFFDESVEGVSSDDVQEYIREINRLKAMLFEKNNRSTKVVVELDMDSDEFVKMGLKEKFIKVLSKE